MKNKTKDMNAKLKKVNIFLCGVLFGILLAAALISVIVSNSDLMSVDTEMVEK